MCQLSGVKKLGGQKCIQRQIERMPWTTIFFIRVLNWPESKSFMAMSSVTWLFRCKCCSSCNLDHLLINCWYASDRWFSHFTPERKMHALAENKGHTNSYHARSTFGRTLNVWQVRRYAPERKYQVLQEWIISSRTIHTHFLGYCA